MDVKMRHLPRDCCRAREKALHANTSFRRPLVTFSSLSTGWTSQGRRPTRWRAALLGPRDSP